MKKYLKITLDFIKKMFKLFIPKSEIVYVEFKKDNIKYGEFNDDSIKEVKKILTNVMISLYIMWETKAAEIVGKEISSIYIEYNNMRKNVKK